MPVTKPRKTLTCLHCKSNFTTWVYRENIAKFCTKSCADRYKKGLATSPDTQFKKGQKPWNAGVKGLILDQLRKYSYKSGHIPWNKGIIWEDMSEENHPKWKGNSVGYSGIHQWIVKKLGTPQSCEHCGRDDKYYYHWANISHEYKRDIADWVRLCVKCHSAYDHGKISLATN